MWHLPGWTWCPRHLSHPSSSSSFHAASHTVPTLLASAGTAAGSRWTASHVTGIEELRCTATCAWWSGRWTRWRGWRISVFIARWPPQRIGRCIWRRFGSCWNRRRRSVERGSPTLICCHRRVVARRRSSRWDHTVTVSLSRIRDSP